MRLACMARVEVCPRAKRVPPNRDNHASMLVSGLAPHARILTTRLTFSGAVTSRKKNSSCLCRACAAILFKGHSPSLSLAGGSSRRRQPNASETEITCILLRKQKEIWNVEDAARRFFYCSFTYLVRCVFKVLLLSSLTGSRLQTTSELHQQLTEFVGLDGNPLVSVACNCVVQLDANFFHCGRRNVEWLVL